MANINDVTYRFIEVYQELIKYKIIDNKKDFAQKIGVSTSLLTEISKGRSNVGVEAIQNAVKYFPISSEWLLSGNGSMLKQTTDVHLSNTFLLRTDRKIEVQDIPLYDTSATAGLLAIFNESNISPEDYLRIPNIPPVDGAIYVRGESMTPLLKSGDIIIYKKLELSLDSILWGQIYLLSFVAGGDTFTVVKYIQKADQPEFIRLVSHNDRFEPKDIPLDSIRALAIVKASITFHTIE